MAEVKESKKLNANSTEMGYKSSILFDGKIDPWRSDPLWKKFIGDEEGKDPVFNLDHHIDIVLGGLLRFLANPRASKEAGLYGRKIDIQMRDINLYCRKLPKSVRQPFVKRLEEILNMEGYSLGQGDEAKFNAEYLSFIFTPKLLEMNNVVSLTPEAAATAKQQAAGAR
uniref:Uncharacterized protein n=1 Tax=Lotharella oceanica TaxID=641309 RepID=A0A7S2U0E5_9EUKA|mmetsp:Transcript_4404/g.8828  ORF Transcript_4404/g.8828 Transcript_4404/m.8828 type:complete len:169 (+) Transcript_4404:82-588(+)|eukprot:CAMPEP_0170171382 /NCGR_PEP_ID=MMETSP0040_2-20121228/4523_1 /TAXON_ID=641309 /ORGANISM="Lotharella oceanica, Strain CCMP622" /LENGTH=168 /DNA_ID=CAMNT_0010411397 /DNA_START=75 /DNA_END=581 /DNA_ORIENTATION=-